MSINLKKSMIKMQIVIPRATTEKEVQTDIGREGKKGGRKGGREGGRKRIGLWSK